jgi:predicted lipoprotein with Yx(FWY)xxD motif
MEKLSMINRRGSGRFKLLMLILLSVVLAACSSGGAQVTPQVTPTITPSITIIDQSVADGTVTVADVFSSGPGWVAIQADNNGQPGTVLGETAVTSGDNPNVVVKIDPTKATPVMYAAIYSDAGQIGTFEPTGADEIQTVGGQPVHPIFNVTGGLPSPTSTTTPGPTPTSAAIVRIYQSSTLGAILMDENGKTLYYWKHDSAGKSYCTGDCLATWTPYLTNGQPKVGDLALKGALGFFVRPDGSQQVTYEGLPVYSYSGDKNPGDTNGQGVDSTWFVLPAVGFPTATPTVTATSSTPEATVTPTP